MQTLKSNSDKWIDIEYLFKLELLSELSLNFNHIMWNSWNCGYYVNSGLILLLALNKKLIISVQDLLIIIIFKLIFFYVFFFWKFET